MNNPPTCFPTAFSLALHSECGLTIRIITTFWWSFFVGFIRFIVKVCIDMCLEGCEISVVVLMAYRAHLSN